MTWGVAPGLHLHCRATCRCVRPGLGVRSINGSWRYIEGDTQPGLWDIWLERFTLTEILAARIVRVLEGPTLSPAKCNFAVWKDFPLLPHLASAP